MATRHRDPNAEIFVSLDLLRMILDLPSHIRIVRTSTVNEREGHLCLRVYDDHLPDPQPADALHLITPKYYKAEAGQAKLMTLTVTPSLERTDHRA